MDLLTTVTSASSNGGTGSEGSAPGSDANSIGRGSSSTGFRLHSTMVNRDSVDPKEMEFRRLLAISESTSKSAVGESTQRSYTSVLSGVKAFAKETFGRTILPFQDVRVARALFTAFKSAPYRPAVVGAHQGPDEPLDPHCDLDDAGAVNPVMKQHEGKIR